MTREEFLFDISDLPKDGYRTLHKILSDHDASQRALIEQQAKELQEKQTLIDSLILAAQSHAQEARTANATIYEIYQCVSGSTGEVGNWHGAQPVRDAMDKQAKELAQLTINHTDINVEFDRLNGVITRQMEEIERLTELAKGYHDTAENRTNDIEQQAREMAFHVSHVDALRRFLSEKIAECQNQAKEIARLRDKLERISRHGPIMGSSGDYRQGQLDVLESVKRIAEEHP